MMKPIYFSFLCLFGLLTLVACNGSKPLSSLPEDGMALELDILDHGAYCSYSDSALLLITDQAAFRQLWEEMHQHESPASDMPEIDFSEHAVVAVFMGARPSGGYSISLERAVQKGNTAYVAVLTQAPGAGCMTTSAITHPFSLTLIDQENVTKARFLVTNQVHDCSN